MKAFLAQRTARERLLLAATALFGLLWLTVTQVWQPLQAHRQALAARIPRLERALAELQARPITLPGDAAAPDPRTAPARITATAESFALQITRLEPQGPALRLTLDQAPFDNLLLWIEVLQRDEQLHLTALALTRRPAPGEVSATLTLEP